MASTPKTNGSSSSGLAEQIYTIEAAAAILGVSDRTLRATLNDGGLKGYKRWGRWYILHGDLVRYLKAAG